MINISDIKPIGAFLKTHGINGELVVQRTSDDVEWDELRCIILILDGIPVPFFVENVRPKSSETDLLQLADVNTEKEAAMFCGLTVYALKTDLIESEDDGQGFYMDDLVGFNVSDTKGNLTGHIIGYDDTTENVLFVVGTEKGNVLIPAVDDFIAEIDVENRSILLDLPPGLVE